MSNRWSIPARGDEETPEATPPSRPTPPLHPKSMADPEAPDSGNYRECYTCGKSPGWCGPARFRSYVRADLIISTWLITLCNRCADQWFT